MTTGPKVLVRLPSKVLPDSHDGRAGAEPWRTSLEGLFATLSGDFRPGDVPVVDVVATDDSGAVMIDDRPAIVGGFPSAPELMLEELTRRLLRRPNLLSGQAGRDTSAGGYLADLGFAPHRADPVAGAPTSSVHQIAEDLIDSLRPDEIVIEAPAEILQRTRDDDLDLVRNLRHDSLVNYGLVFPDVRLQAASVPDAPVGLRLNDLHVPVYGLDSHSSWRDVVDALVRTVRPRTCWFLRKRDVASGLDNVRYLMPDLVQSCLERYPLSTVTAVLREMARSSRSIRNLGRLVWILLDIGVAEAGPDRFALTETSLLAGQLAQGPRGGASDPVVLAALVRKALNEESWRIGTLEMPHAGRLSADTERLLAVTGDGEDQSALAGAEWRALSEVAQLRHPRLLVVRQAAAIPSVASCVQALPDPPRVVSSQELPPDADLATIPVAKRTRG
jgi:hypothetical protein